MTELITICGWCNPVGSESRSLIEAKLTPTQALTDAICQSCTKDYMEQLRALQKPIN